MEMKNYAKEETRTQLCLNGLWDFAPSGDPISVLPQPAAFDPVKIKVPSPFNINGFMPSHPRRYAGGEEVRVQGGDFRLYPEYPARWEKAKCGFYRRSFSLTKEEGKRYFLRFDAVAFHSFIYLNGVLLKETMEAFLPVEVEITDAAREGENELLVACESAGYLTYRGKDGRNRLDWPRGSFFGEFVAGIWQDAWLISRPAEFISDVFPVTDVRTRRMDVTFEISGLDRTKPAKVRFFLTPWNTDGEERYLGSADAPDGTFTWEWKEGEVALWDSFEPNLYVLTARLHRGDGTIDEKKTRIGFRTVWTEGEKLILNGRPIQWKIDAWHYLGYTVQTEEFARAYYRMAKDAGVNVIRLHAEPFPEFFLDIADEYGMMIVSESAVWASHCIFSYSPAFFENCKTHLASMLLRDRSHPSVVTWSPENECIPAFMFCGSDWVKDVPALEDRVWEFVRTVYDYDTSRPVSCDGSGDLRGRLPLNSLHYPHYDCPTKRGKPITIGEMGSMYYPTPDEVTREYGREAIESFDGRLRAVAEEAHHDLIGERKWAAQICVFNLLWYGLRPLPFTDRLLTYDDYTTPGIKPSRITPYMRTLNAGAEEGLPDYLPNPVWEAAADAYIPARAFAERLPSHVRAGEETPFSVTVFNDLRDDGDFLLTASLGKGKNVLRQELHIRAAEYAELTLPFTPARPGKTVLRLSLSLNGTVLHSCAYGLTVLDPKEYHAYPFPVVTEGDPLPEGPYIDCRKEKPYADCLVPASQQSFFLGRERVRYPAPVPCSVFGAAALFPAEPVLTDGRGNAVVLSLRCAGERRLISGLDLTKNDAVTAYLRRRVSEELEKEPVLPASPFFLGDPSSDAALMLTELGCEPEYIDRQRLSALLDEKQTRLLIVDGSAGFDRVELFSAFNFPSVLFVSPSSVPPFYRNSLRLTGRNLCHLIAREGEGDRFGLSSNALYGLEAGNEQILCRDSFECGTREDVLFGVPDENFMAWNHVGEPLKTVAVLRTGETDSSRLAGLVRKTYAGSAIYLTTLAANTDSPKLKNIWARLLSAFGVKFGFRSGDELTDLLRSGIWAGHVKRMLCKTGAENEDLSHLRPGVNTVENGAAWRIVRESDRRRENALYALYVTSPQDRRDLLLNPDFIDLEVGAEAEVTVLLNGTPLGTGKDLTLTGIPLRSGVNLLLLSVPGSSPMPRVVFRRVKEPRLDLTFSLRAGDLVPVPMKGVRWKASVNDAYASHASFTREHFWPTTCPQEPGITLDFTFPDEVTVSGLWFYAIKFRNEGDEYLPARYRILCGPDADRLTECYASLDEKEMFYPRGRVLAEFGRTVTARTFRFELTGSKPKELVIEDLLLFR